MVGCQGFSAAKSSASSPTGTQGTSGNPLPGDLTAAPTSLSFGNVQVGTSQTQTETVQNTGGTNATISAITTTGTGFSMSGFTAPVTLAPGQSATFSVIFAPQTAGNFSGGISMSSDASNPNFDIPLVGSSVGASQGQLTVSPSTVSVGNVTVGTSRAQTGTLTATGESIVVSAVNVGSAEFSVSGLSFPLTLAAGQSTSFTATFTPQANGLASSSISFTSNASNSPSSTTVTGTGVAAPVHSVDLSWTASSSPYVVGYNIYRRMGTSGSYTKINTAVDAATTYTDTAVTDGDTYYYQTTAVNSSNEESVPSSTVQAAIPPL